MAEFGQVPSKVLIRELVNVKPEELLRVIFKPILFTTKLIGCLPIQIDESTGLAYFKWFSLKSLYSMLITLGLIGLTTIITPFVAYTLNYTQRNFIEMISEVAFMMGQFLASSLTTILIPFLTKRFCRIWNQLHFTLVNLCSYSNINYVNLNQQHFNGSYVCSYLAVFSWAAFVVLYWVFTWLFYKDRIYAYFGQNGETISHYYLALCAQFLFILFLSAHVIQSLIFGSICGVIFQSFKFLSKIPMNLNNNELNRKRFLEYLETYESLVDLVQQLSTTYGAYLILQFTNYMVCSLSNFVALFWKQFKMDASTITQISAISVYLLWLVAVGFLGEAVHDSICKCRNSLRIASLKYKVPGRVIYAKLGDTPPYITAWNFFPINRGMIAAVLGTLTTYLVVLFQFKVSSSNG